MNGQLTVTCVFHIDRQQKGRQQLRHGAAPDRPVGRVPRIARLMALAIRCQQLIREGTVADQSELSRRGHITTAWMTQIMSLLNLAPDIQEQLLFLPRTERGRDLVKEIDIRQIARPAKTAPDMVSSSARLGQVTKTIRTIRANDPTIEVAIASRLSELRRP